MRALCDNIRYMRALLKFLVCSILGIACSLLPIRGQARKKPNFIVILADDLGWGDLSSYGARQIRTPELDRLAAQGVRFDQFYSASPVCSPARAALLTGRYPFRSGITHVLHPHSKKGIPPQEKLLPEVLRAAGYRTAIFGKWHLGDSPEYLPLQNGFDEFYGIPYSNNMHPLYFIDGNQPLQRPEPIQAHLTSVFTEKAKEFIEENRDNPFFLYLPQPMPHYPIDAVGKWRGSSEAGRYGDVVQELDASVGELVTTLQQLGIEKDTILFFTSDNGSWRRRSNEPLRGKKRTGWEGGFRVPLVVYGPGRLASGKVSQRPSMMFDLYATILDLAGVNLPAHWQIDGRSLLGQLGGPPADLPERGPLDALFYFRRAQIDALRVGRWKLHVGRTSRIFGRHEITPQLYDLTEDPGEEDDVAAQRPGVVEALLDRLEEFFAENPSLKSGQEEVDSP